jgi:diguanylate cyclase (GGDEF)-like protein
VSDGSERSVENRAWWFPVAIACIAIAAGIAGSHMWQSIAFAYVACSIIPLAAIGSRTKRIDRRLALGLVGFGLCSAGANVLRTLSEHDEKALIWSEVLALLTTVAMIATIGTIARNRRGADFWSILADAGIVALGSWLLSWVTIVRPTINRFSHDPLLTVVRGAFQPLGAIVIFLLIIVMFSEKARTPAVIFTSLAILLTLAGGLLRGLHDSERIGDHRTLDTVLCTIAIGLLFSAILNPTVRTLTTRLDDGRQRGITGRLIVTALALIVPIIVMGSTNPDNAADRIVRTVSVAVLAVFVTVRTIQAARTNRAAQASLIHSAQSDALTGLPNRALLLEKLNVALFDAWKGEEHPTLFFIDLDRFKNVNDSLGHYAGDQVLCEIADRLRTVVPERATVARISGDEYVVFDPASPSLTDAMALANRLLDRVREPVTLTTPNCDIFVTASVGVARLEPQSHRNADDLLRHADTAMYQAKDAGRNCVALFDESKNERASHRLSVETALFRALDRDELRLYYQPILEVTTGEVTGFEALMRWRQADGTIVPPIEFIPIAEESGTIVKLGAWALLEAMTQLRTWIDQGVCSPHATMSVNVSPRQLADPTFAVIVNESLLKARVSPGLLWLEVTESIMISEPDVALATLRRLRTLGAKVAIDDFGTGYSSLSSLQQFPLNRIKIDRAFVQGLGEHPTEANMHDHSLVRTIIAMAQSLELDMVAEGVETIDQLRALRDLGCTKAQGYLISRPMPPEAMRSTVAALSRVGAWPGLAPTDDEDRAPAANALSLR